MDQKGDHLILACCPQLLTKAEKGGTAPQQSVRSGMLMEIQG